jgi:transposase
MDAFSIPELLAEIERLRRELAVRDRRVEQLEQTIRDLHSRLQAVQRAAKRQAAPFSKGKPKAKPKKPGRKKGEDHGKHGHRPPPESAEIDETLEAALPECCPDCGGVIEETHVDEQFQTEIPRKPIHRKFNVHCGRCQECGKHCRGRHPLQTSDAVGAAASQLGPDAQATVVYLNKHAGMSYGKIADTFARCFGISVSRGACTRMVLRAGEQLKPVYQEIKEHIKESKHITPDETGWRIGGRPAWLHVGVGDDGTTCYVIDPHRGAEVLAGIIGFDWSGTMTHDGCPSYDRFQESCHQQCVDHAMRRARELADKQQGAAKRFPNQVIDLFAGALHTRDQYLAGDINDAALADAHEDYVSQLLDLTVKPRVNELNETFAKHLYNHGEQWFQFLVDPSIPATNHRAEQALKTPIVNRKVCGGNRTDNGKEAQEIVCSVLQTCKNKAIEVVDYISSAFCGAVANLFTR